MSLEINFPFNFVFTVIKKDSNQSIFLSQFDLSGLDETAARPKLFFTAVEAKKEKPFVFRELHQLSRVRCFFYFLFFIIIFDWKVPERSSVVAPLISAASQ